MAFKSPRYSGLEISLEMSGNSQTSVNPNFTTKLNALNRDFVEIKRTPR